MLDSFGTYTKDYLVLFTSLDQTFSFSTLSFLLSSCFAHLHISHPALHSSCCPWQSGSSDCPHCKEKRAKVLACEIIIHCSNLAPQTVYTVKKKRTTILACEIIIHCIYTACSTRILKMSNIIWPHCKHHLPSYIYIHIGKHVFTHAH